MNGRVRIESSVVTPLPFEAAWATITRATDFPLPSTATFLHRRLSNQRGFGLLTKG